MDECRVAEAVATVTPGSPVKAIAPAGAEVASSGARNLKHDEAKLEDDAASIIPIQVLALTLRGVLLALN